MEHEKFQGTVEDGEAVRERFLASATHYEDHAKDLRAMAEKIVERLTQCYCVNGYWFWKRTDGVVLQQPRDSRASFLYMDQWPEAQDAKS